MIAADKSLPVSVLFVDDDEDVREQMSMALDRVVDHVFMAANGMDGFRMFQAHRPDIVVTDIMMPEMDGVELSRLIRENDPAAKIIVMSAHDDSELLKELIDIGVDAFATKPVIGNKFFMALERCASQVVNCPSRVLPLMLRGPARADMPHPVADIGSDTKMAERLAKVEGELNKKNLELEQFLYTVSHDLRGPLVTIKSFLGFLEQDIVDRDDVRIGADLDFIRVAADRMEMLLNELLEISRIGRSVNPYESMLYESIVAEVLENLDINPNVVDVTCRADGGEYLLCGVRKHFLLIWQVLLDNALKFMGDQPEPCIEIGVAVMNGETVFSVRDNGIGLAAEYHEKIFGIFEKLDRTSSGVGMGLAIARRIVEHYRGRIWAESCGPGMGSCFSFTLPAAMTKDGTCAEQ